MSKFISNVSEWLVRDLSHFRNRQFLINCIRNFAWPYLNFIQERSVVFLIAICNYKRYKTTIPTAQL